MREQPSFSFAAPANGSVIPCSFTLRHLVISMLSVKSSLPVFLALFVLVSPLALRADQAQPTQSDTARQATQVSYQDLQTDSSTTVDDTALLISSQDLDTSPIIIQPIDIQPIDIEPIGQPTQLPIDAPVDAAVTPEPSGVVLLATGVLCGTLFWMRRRSFAMMAC